jgi:hypothetical protein
MFVFLSFGFNRASSFFSENWQPKFQKKFGTQVSSLSRRAGVAAPKIDPAGETPARP